MFSGREIEPVVFGQGCAHGFAFPDNFHSILVIAAIGVPIVLAYTASIYYIFRGKTTLTTHSY